MNNEVNLRSYAANKLKHLREFNNITQDELADKLSKKIGKEVKRQTVSLYENGDRGMNQDVLFALSDIFDVSINVFFPNTKRKEQHDEYKKILKEKGLMDDNDYINKESFNKLMKIADMIESLDKKKEN